MNTLTIHHQDGNWQFKLVSGGYDFDGSHLTVSLETEPGEVELEDDKCPQCAHFCLANYPVEAPGLAVGAEFHFRDDHSGGWDNKNTHANAYFGFHAQMVDLKFKLLNIDSGMITCELSAVTDDIDYYDSRAKPSPTSGVFQLPKKSKDELWIPT